MDLFTAGARTQTGSCKRGCQICMYSCTHRCPDLLPGACACRGDNTTATKTTPTMAATSLTFAQVSVSSYATCGLTGVPATTPGTPPLPPAPPGVVYSPPMCWWGCGVV